MNSTLSGPISSRLADETVQIPAAWRAKQAILLALTGLTAIYYALFGYRSPAGESGKADNLSPFDFVGFLLFGVLVWLMTPAAWTIATTTFQEAIRRRWVTLLLGFAVVMMGVSTFFTFMSPGEQQKFLRDYGIGFTVLLTLIAAIFLGVALIPPEIERRTIFTILSKPVTRLEVLLGKYVGVMLVLALNLFVMGAIFLIAYARFVAAGEGGFAHAMLADGTGLSIKGLGFDLFNLSKAMLLHLGALSIIAALALALSQVATNIVAIIGCFVVYFLGQSASYWERLGGEGGSAPTLSPAIRTIVDALYFLLPRLDRFDVRERLVSDLPVGLNYMLKASASGAIYTAVLLTVAYFFWSDKEF